jgi:hypothetical protein
MRLLTITLTLLLMCLVWTTPAGAYVPLAQRCDDLEVILEKIGTGHDLGMALDSAVLYYSSLPSDEEEKKDFAQWTRYAYEYSKKRRLYVRNMSEMMPRLRIEVRDACYRWRKERLNTQRKETLQPPSPCQPPQQRQP